MNQDIISEINGIKKITKKTKFFLKWLLEFEKDHLDKNRFAFKEEILKAININTESADK